MAPEEAAPEVVGAHEVTGAGDLSLRVEVLSEELAIADEEITAQQSEIEALLARADSARATLQEVLGTVPCPVVSTDASGSTLSANALFAALVGVPPARLVRKPVQAYVVAASRGAARSLVSRAVESGTAAGTLGFSPRLGVERDLHVVITRTRSAGGSVVLHWVLADAGASADGAPGAPDASDVEGLRAVASLTTLPVGRATTHELLVEVAALTTRAIPGASWSSVDVGDPAQPVESAADSAEAQGADGAQVTAGEGPCVEAHRSDAPVLSSDLAHDARWPRLARLARGGPVRGALAVPLRTAAGVAGVLGVYSAAVDGIRPGRDVDRAVLFGDAASAVLSSAQRVEELRRTAEDLREAMRFRAPIEQAKGVVASHLGCTVEEAFAAISSLSQDRNVKVRDLAVLVASNPSDAVLDDLLAAALERARARSARAGAP